MNETVIEINKNTGEIVILSSIGVAVTVDVKSLSVSNNSITLKINSTRNPSVP